MIAFVIERATSRFRLLSVPLKQDDVSLILLYTEFRTLVKSVYPKKFLFLGQTYALGTQKNRLNKTDLLSTLNI